MSSGVDPGLTQHIAAYHLAQGDPDAASAVLQNLVGAEGRDPGSREAAGALFATVAEQYAGRGMHDAAVAALAHAFELDDGPCSWRAAAGAAAARGDLAAAARWWHRVADAARHDGAAWLALGRACEAAGLPAEAVAAYLGAARAQPGHAGLLTIARRLDALAPASEADPPSGQIRIALLGSATLDQLGSYVGMACRLAGLTPRIYVGPFGQLAQQILDPQGGLYASEPDVVVLATHGRSLFPELYDHPFRLEEAARRAAIAPIVDDLAALLTALTARTSALVLLHSFATPQHSPMGILDRREPFGQAALFAALNEALAARLRRDFPSVYLLDEDRVLGRIGKCTVTDPRLWLLGRIALAPAALEALAAEYLRYVKPLKGRSRKCLVLDLDNTLWGGVVGEDGPSGIVLGREAPGNAFRAFQEVILDLWERGILLAIVSKNNEADALEVLERHPDMILRPRHFAAIRINWLDKSVNLRSIAEELNIGLESLSFMDDSATECYLVRAQLPQVLTVQLPRDPARYRATLLEMTDFEILALTDEDRRRGALYAQRRERLQWEDRHAGNLNEYLADLGLVVEVAVADSYDLPRVAQLISKTNQFNLTGRRHGEGAIRAFAQSGGHLICAMRVRDRFGDHGLVGAAILALDGGGIWTIDTLVVSCRVLGRGAETAFLSALASAARVRGGTRLRGLFVASAKNAQTSDLYPRHGFSPAGQRAMAGGPAAGIEAGGEGDVAGTGEGDGGTEGWLFDLADELAAPSWLTLTYAEEGSRADGYAPASI